MSDKMREEFEAYYNDEILFLDGQYVMAGTNSCVGHARVKQIAWQAWQASRQAIEVELPESATVENEWDDYEIGYNNGIESTADAIRAAGIRIKGK